jgi:hypothetical protein
MQTLPDGDEIGVVTIEEAIVFFFVNIVAVDDNMMIFCREICRHSSNEIDDK